jgi:hypothetical protein
MTMRSAIALLFVLLAHALCAQDSLSAEGWFNKAAKEYVKQDRSTALRSLEHGLRRYPGDPAMLALAERLLQEDQNAPQPQQQPQQQQQQQQQQQSEQEQPPQPRSGNEQPRDPQQDRPSTDRSREKLDPETVRRILDAVEQQERATQEKVREKTMPRSRKNIEKDW